MADSKISALPAATTALAGTEVLPIVQSSTTKQVSVANLTAGRAISAASLALTTALPVASGGFGNAIGSLPTNTITFTNLSTSYVDIGTLDAGAVVCVSLGSVDSSNCIFVMGMAFDGGSLNIGATNISGATIVMVGAAATITMAGDARTYTIQRNGANGYYQIKASSLATGNTTFKYTYFGSR